MKLHCYENDHTTVVAESLEEARAQWDEWVHFDTKDYDDSPEIVEDEHDIRPIPDDRILSIFVEDELKSIPKGLVSIGATWKAPAGEWAQSQGKGFLCTTEY